MRTSDALGLSVLHLLSGASLSASDLFPPWQVVCLGNVVVLVTVE